MKSKKVLSGILAILGVAAGLTAVYFAVKESPEAHEALSEARENAAEKGEELTMVDEAIVMGKNLKKTAVATGAAVTFVAGSYISGALAVAAAGTAAYAWQKKYLDLDKELSKLSPELRKKLHIDQAKEAVEKKLKAGEVKPKKPFGRRRPDEEFPVYDEYTDQIIWTTENKLYRARDLMARRISGGRSVVLNDINVALGGKATNDETFKKTGWSVHNEEQQEYFYSSEDGYFVDITLGVAGKDQLFDKEMLYLFYSIPPVVLDDDEL